jgi:hypothetical protein
LTTAVIDPENAGDELAARCHRGSAGSETGDRFSDNQSVQDVLTGRIDDVEEHDEDGDPEQIPVASDQLESAFRP